MLVLGDDIRSFLAVIRSLGRVGVEVHIGGHPKDSLAQYSRYVRTVHRIPKYDHGTGEWVSALAGCMKRERFDLVLPCSDPSLIPLQLHRAKLEQLGRIYLLDDDVYQVVSDKLKVNALARAAGVRLPREWIVHSPDQAAALRAELPLPVVLKPRSSFTGADVSNRQNVRKVYDWADFLPLITRMLESGPVAVQENFIGRGVGVELLLHRGTPLLEFQHVRLHEPLQGGGSYYRTGVDVTPALRQAALAVLGPLGYTGVAMAEFKVNQKTGDWVFIEVNARFWGSLPLAVASGADFPAALYEMLVEGRREFPQGYQRGLCCRYWTGDASWQIANLRADKSDSTLATVPLRSVVREPIVNVLTLRERSDTLTFDDPRPGVIEIGRVVKALAGGFGRRSHRWWLQRGLVRRWLERRARSALATARTVLFVCKGNICRSPFAQRVAEERPTPNQVYLSAGYYPVEGRPSPTAAVAAAAQCGVELSSHRSEVLRAEHVRRADAIFVFDIENYRQIVSSFPCRRKVHFIGALDHSGPLWVEDPYGGTGEQFAATYSRIRELLVRVTRPEPAGQTSPAESPRTDTRDRCPSPSTESGRVYAE